jgi:NAD-dependent DNA ligase
MVHTIYNQMDVLVAKLTKANEAYRSGQALIMTDEEYDAGMEELAKKVPNHPLLKKVRAAPADKGRTVKMPYYLGSLDKAKVGEDLTKWIKKCEADSTFLVSEKLDGISGLWSPVQRKLYLSGDDNMGLDVSAWLQYMNVSTKGVSDEIPDDVWIRGELIMEKNDIPEGRLGRSIVNGIFHHSVPDPDDAALVNFVCYEVIGMDPSLTARQQFAWIEHWGLIVPWHVYMKTLSGSETLTKLLAIRRDESEYDMDGLVIKTNKPIVPRIVKGNPKDAIAWKPPNGEAKLTKVVLVEWNASSTGKLIPRVQIEPVHLGGSTINYVTGVNARRVVDWGIGPSATVIIRKGGDVIPVIDRVETPAAVVFPADGTWEWEGGEAKAATASNIVQKLADNTTISAQFMKMVTRLGWEGIGPAQMKAVVDAGYTTVPLLRKVSEADLKKLLGPVKGTNLYKIVQTDGWSKATELDLFVASPVCPSGIGKTRLEALMVSESDVTKWSSPGVIAPKGWSVDALKEFQDVWKAYETLRKEEWTFIPYPIKVTATTAVTAVQVPLKGSVVFTGFRDAALEASLLAKGYKLVDAVKSDTKAVLIADKEDPATYTSTKIEKAKKIPGCMILRRSDWGRL